MSKIIQLSETLTNRIAAGEVVERPAGIVKELIENAIDAQASEIIIHVTFGGLNKIVVTDNGEGMDQTDLRDAFKRHSTSKIKNESDLHSIISLGFRGEALPSIASVSKVSATSSFNHESYEIKIDNGQEVSFGPKAHPQGTTIEVSDLFYKIPARLKHLRTPQYESVRIKSLIHQFMLGYPDISFTLLSDEKEVLNTKGNGQLDEILYQIYGMEVASMLKPFEGQSQNFKVHGMFVLPHIHRSNRYHQYFYLNSRMINYYALNQVVVKEFHRYMPSDRYPILVLNIESDVKLVDVNVHPSKWTVRISQEKELLELVERTLQSALQSQMGVRTVSPSVVEKPEFQTIFESAPITQHYTYQPNTFEEEPRVKPTVSTSHDMVVLAQHHGKYILAEDENGLYLFDQHAAMERVQYEHYQRQLNQSQHEQQSLLFPIVIKSVDPLIEKLDETQSHLKEVGIIVEQLSEHDLVVRSIPLWLDLDDASNFISSLFDSLENDYKFNLTDLNKDRLAMMACKSSIRFNEHRSLGELQKIVDDLMHCEQPYHCPHGRPTFVKIDPKQLLKEFSR